MLSVSASSGELLDETCHLVKLTPEDLVDSLETRDPYAEPYIAMGVGQIAL